MANPEIDGPDGYGLPEETVTIDSVDYVVEDYSVDVSTEKTQRYGPGDTRGQAFRKGFTTGSITLQLADADTPLPPELETFTADLLKKGSDQTWYIEKVNGKFGMKDYQVATCDIAMQENAPA